MVAYENTDEYSTNIFRLFNGGIQSDSLLGNRPEKGEYGKTRGEIPYLYICEIMKCFSFSRVCRSDNDMRELFKFHKLPEDELRTSEEVRELGGKIFQMIDNIVGKIGDLDDAVALCKDMASVHMKMAGFSKVMCVVSAVCGEWRVW